MKTMLVVFGTLLAALCCFITQGHAQGGAISFVNVEVLKVLEFYKELSGATPVIDSRVKRVTLPITVSASTSSKEEALKLIEKALIGQAAVVLTRLDEKRVSVTYNDALPIKGSSAAKDN